MEIRDFFSLLVFLTKAAEEKLDDALDLTKEMCGVVNNKHRNNLEAFVLFLVVPSSPLITFHPGITERNEKEAKRYEEGGWRRVGL